MSINSLYFQRQIPVQSNRWYEIGTLACNALVFALVTAKRRIGVVFSGCHAHTRCIVYYLPI